jgi:hypothetical protein
MSAANPFDLNALRLTDDQVRVLTVVPRKIQNRRQQFVRVPWLWVERLRDARGRQSYRLALCLLYLHWKGNGEPIKLANGMLALDGVSRHSKYRALQDLERLGLISVERQPRKSPTVKLVLWNMRGCATCSCAVVLPDMRGRATYGI